MTEPIRPVEETNEYAAAAENEAPLPALIFRPPEGTAAALAAATLAARAHAAAVHDTEVFVVRLDHWPAAEDVVAYAALVDREEETHAQRRVALAAVGLGSAGAGSGNTDAGRV